MNKLSNQRRFGAEDIRPLRGVLFVDSQGIGDVVQTLPLLRAVCSWAERRWPVYVLFAAHERYEIVCGENLTMRPIFMLGDDGESCWRSLWRKLAGKIDLIVSAPEISASKLLILKYALGARFAIAEAPSMIGRFLTLSVKQSWTRPWAETIDEIASGLDIPGPLPPPSLHLTAREKSWAEAMVPRPSNHAQRFVLGLQCPASVPQKRWPAERFASLVQLMQRQFPGLRVISFGTETERDQVRQVQRQLMNISWLEGAGRWSIRETFAMLALCDLFISGDTGLMHVAAALGIPTVSIFGPTSASRRAPKNSRAIAVCPDVPCHPCFRGKWTPCDCIRSISAERVLAAVKQAMFGSEGQGHMNRSLSIETEQVMIR